MEFILVQQTKLVEQGNRTERVVHDLACSVEADRKLQAQFRKEIAKAADADRKRLAEIWKDSLFRINALINGHMRLEAAQKRTDRQLARTARQLAQTGRQLAQTDRRLGRTDRQVARTGRQLAETERRRAREGRQQALLMRRSDQKFERLLAALRNRTNGRPKRRQS